MESTDNLDDLLELSDEQMDRLMFGIDDYVDGDSIGRLDPQVEDFLRKLEGVTLNESTPYLPVEPQIQAQQYAEGKLFVPVGYVPQINDRDGELDEYVKQFIKKYNLDMPSSLYMRAKRVFNAEASIAGFAFENFLAAAICFHSLTSRSRKISDQFILYNYIKERIEYGRRLHIDMDAVEEALDKYLPADGHTFLDKYPGPIDLPSRLIFLEYCKNRIPGVGKPAGASQAIGPDLCMWLSNDVFLALGSKISKKLYEYDKSQGEGKSPSQLVVSKDELMDNVFSVNINKYGVTRASELADMKENGGKSKKADYTFAMRVKDALFNHPNPLKLYIEVNCVLPFQPTDVSMGEKEYDLAIDPMPYVRQEDIRVGNEASGKTFKLDILRLNLYNTNFIESGLLLPHDDSTKLLKELLFDPLDRLNEKIKEQPKNTQFLRRKSRTKQ